MYEQNNLTRHDHFCSAATAGVLFCAPKRKTWRKWWLNPLHACVHKSNHASLQREFINVSGFRVRAARIRNVDRSGAWRKNGDTQTLSKRGSGTTARPKKLRQRLYKPVCMRLRTCRAQLDVRYCGVRSDTLAQAAKMIIDMTFTSTS
jgi:hypothetical protein